MKQSNHSYITLSGDTVKLFSWKTLLLSVVGLAINLSLAKLVIYLGLPLYVDNVGSLLTGALAGPIPGAMVGFISNAVNSLQDPITMYYGILTIIMAILASLYTKKGLFRSFGGCLLATGSFVCIGGAMGSVMTWLLYGGGIGGIGAPMATGLNSWGIPAFLSQLLSDIFIDIPDKAITVCLVVLLIKLCTRLFSGTFPLSRYYDEPLSELKSEAVSEKKNRHSVNALILQLIILCSALVSVATILTGFFFYCRFTENTESRLTYLIQLASVSFAVSILICIITIWLATRRISAPLNQIVQQSREFLAMPSENWLTSEAWTQRVPIKTGDEIEELYDTICIEQETVAHNVIRMKETEEQLRHSKELEDALENARQASKAKGQFLSRMSHEIRTPLNAVIGYMDIASASPDDPKKLMHCVQNTSLAAKHLLSIINDVLDFSSIENGKMKIAHEEFSLKDLLLNISAMFYTQSKEKGIRFDTVLHGALDEQLVGDSLRVNQVLLNLISNAVKFTPKGGSVTLDVSQLHYSDDRIYMKFVVTDTGIGMSKEFKERLFKPFEQESAATAQQYGGSGLGLSISGNMVSMMNGAIDVTSQQGKGSCFTVTIPFDRPVHSAAVSGGRKLRALLVMSDEAQAVELKTIFKSCSVLCDIAHSADAVERQLKARDNSKYAYEYCFLDWNASDVNCADIVKTIRHTKTAQPVQCVAMAYDGAEIYDEATAVGVTEFLTKPVFPSSVIQCVSNSIPVQTDTPDKEDIMDALAGMNVLLAEDNAMNREIAVSILKKAGMLVDSVENGQEAVDAFTAHPEKYQVILMDIQMPVLDGFGATREIRKLDVPGAKTIPIIAMTANAFKEDIAAALSAGMNDHIAKPVDYKKLFKSLQNHAKI